MNDKYLASLQIQFYNDAKGVLLGSLRTSAEFGCPLRCGDGKICRFYDTIAVVPADYNEV